MSKCTTCIELSMPPSDHISTAGDEKHYRPVTVYMLDVEAQRRDEQREPYPPIHMRRTSQKFSLEPPPPRSTIGFVSGQRLQYLGRVIPCPNMQLEIPTFSWMAQMFVTVADALQIFMNGQEDATPLTTRATSYIQKILVESPGTFTVVDIPDAMYDTLLLLKLLGAAPRRARSVKCVPTSEIDALLPETNSLQWTRRIV